MNHLISVETKMCATKHWNVAIKQKDFTSGNKTSIKLLIKIF